MADEFTVQGQVADGVGSLSWNGAVDGETLARAVSLAADDLILAREVRRLEVSIPATDMRRVHFDTQEAEDDALRERLKARLERPHDYTY